MTLSDKQNFLRWNRNPTKPTIKLDPSWAACNRFRKESYGRQLNREQWIAALVKQHGWTRGAELGICKGRTFLFVLDACPDLTLIGVDLWAPQPDNPGIETYDKWDHVKGERYCRSEARAFGERAIIIKDWTVNAAKQIEDNSLDFVFIDADHSTEAVRNDIDAWWPKVKDTGWIIGHDIHWPVVKVVADEILPGYVIGPDNAWGRVKYQ